MRKMPHATLWSPNHARLGRPVLLGGSPHSGSVPWEVWWDIRFVSHHLELSSEDFPMYVFIFLIFKGEKGRGAHADVISCMSLTEYWPAVHLDSAQKALIAFLSQLKMDVTHPKMMQCFVWWERSFCGRFPLSEWKVLCPRVESANQKVFPSGQTQDHKGFYLRSLVFSP